MRRSFLVLFLCTIPLSAQYFTKVTTGPQSNDGGDSRSVNWVDYDNDGDLDLFISNGSGTPVLNFLYRNNGNGTFTKVTDQSVVKDPGSYDGSTWADFDNDGTLDAFTVTWYGQRNSLHRQRNGAFEKVLSRPIAEDATHSETASWGDYDNDGYVDLYVANSSEDTRNILYHNNGNGTFTRVLTGALVNDTAPTRSVEWCDLDNDGDLDLFMANEGGASEFLYWNNGNGTFTAESGSAIVTSGGDSFGSSVGDIDNDGDFDILVVNHANTDEALYRNNGDRTFIAITGDPVVSSGGYSVGSAFGDLDNDGDLDLVVTNAFSGSSPAKNFLYLNNGNGTFVKVDTGIVSNDPGWSYGVAFGDYDRDGDLDIAMGNCFGANQNNALYRNNGNANAWLTVKSVGTVSNRSAIGATVRVKALINGKSVWQLRQVAGQSGYCGQNLESHFGLGDAAVVESLIVAFPSGKKVIQTNVPVRQLLTVTEPRPPGFFRGALQIGTFREMAPATVQFKDLSQTDPAQPATHWAWDLNGDGITDANTASAQFTYTKGETVSVSLIVGNGVRTDTVRAPKSILITPSTAVLAFNTATHNFGIIDVNTPVKDTTMFIYNRGKLADSITVALIYGSSTPGTVKPDSALDVAPRSFVLAPNDSQAVTFTMYPRRFIRTNLNITYTPRIVITSVYNDGVKSFEKTMWVKLQGTLTRVADEGFLPLTTALHQNFPNPFNPGTTLRFDIAESSPVSIVIYDALGRMVRTVTNGPFAPGSYSVPVTMEGLASGLYLCRLTAGSYSGIRTMLLLK